MFKILLQPYDLLEHQKFRFIISFGGAAFVILFSLIFQPFGLYKLSFLTQLKWMLLYMSGGLSIQLLLFFVVQPHLIRKFTIGKTLLWLLVIAAFISIYGFVVNAYLLCNGVFRFINFFAITRVIILDSLIPISLIILFHYNFILKKQLNELYSLNKQLDSKMISKYNPIIEIPAENPKNSIKISLHSILFISSADNYVDVHFIKDEVYTCVLLRNTLTGLTDVFIPDIPIIRCHRSYMINLYNVKKVIRNTSGYFVKIQHFDSLIPVSRKYSKEVLSALKK